MVAFHYPPWEGGTGVHRTQKFARYLPDEGWQPIILTASPHAYTQKQSANGSIPSTIPVWRAFALDAARHLSIHGSYLPWTAVPDRWISWFPSAVAVGANLIRKHRPDVIWSTYPIATAHLIGLALQRWSGLPWVADFRDPMIDVDPTTGEIYPADRLVRRVSAWIEDTAVQYCSRAVFTSAGAHAMYSNRFPHIPQSRWATISNGYDEEDFAGIESECRPTRQASCGPVVLIHSGVMYPCERDPTQFFDALAYLRRTDQISPEKLQITLRATGHDEYIRAQLRSRGIEDLVFLEPPIAHRAAVAELLDANGLLVLQASSCNRQVPAKVYEYLRARRPIFAMTDPAGDTAALLKSEGVNWIVPLNSWIDIAAGLLKFQDEIRNGQTRTRVEVGHLSRKSRTRELALLLNSICALEPHNSKS